ncbi:MAG: hypothetical protein HOV71_05690 [Hamadaea sp.]|nr:hypothetical protein [Hamadaea sp.]NUR47611.1 hypothetical protein [Hamadaea sp.]NUT07010.1 hypothetical protein [Hamadaea sp.]
MLGGAMALLVGCGIAMAAPQAAQASYTSWVAASSWAYTDSRDADALHVGEAGGLPVGTWLDAAGKHHMSRAYFTFDLRPYAGKQILRAMGVVDEIAVNDCGTARDWELWRTDPVSSATDWRNPPAEVERLDDPVPSPACPAHYSEALLTGVFQRALGEGRESVTLELRIPADREGNPHLGRRVAPLHVSMTANATPDAPTELSVDAKSCASGDPLWVSDLRPNLRALLADPDSAPPGDAEPLTATFALWPIDQPDARVEWTYGQLSAPFYASTTVPAGAIEDGKSYAFAVRSADGDAESQWSAPCSFTVDSVRPRVTPTISSEDFQDYPAKGYVGVPGTFTFTANGVADVVGFYWGEWLPGTFVAADRPGGSATVTWTPTSEGPASIRVMSVDRAGNTSDSASYSFRITSSAPSVQDTTPDAWPGDAHTLLIRAGLPDTASYAYSLDDGAEQTVTAAADGTAQLSVTPKLTGSWFSIHGIGAAGQVSATTRVFLTVQSAPIVTSTQFPQNGVGAPVGTEGVFHFAPRMSGVTQYLYSYDSGPWQTVTAGQDGAADITLRPATPGTHRLVVYSRTTDGVDSMRTAYYFSPASIAPNVDSPDYPEGIEAGGPGITGRFVFTPVADDVVEYVYSVNGGPEQTIAADPMGWGVLDWAPPGIGEDNSGLFIMRVRSRSGDGQVSDAREYWIVAALLAPGVESDIFDPFGTAKVGQPGVFTFTSHQPDAVEFVYSIDGGPQQTLPVGSDGRSTLSFTADSPYSHDVVVRTRRADGVTSGSDFLSFWVAPAE